MQSFPKIYVIIPVYNCEKYLTQAVMSIINQPYKDIDIILVNDGSKDNSPLICEQLKTEYDNIHVIHQDNQGVSVARNTGIEYVLNLPSKPNSYIAFLDSDDLWAKDCLTDDVVSLFDKDIICFMSCNVSNDLKTYLEHYIDPNFGRVMNGGTGAIWGDFHHFATRFVNIDLYRKYNIRFDVSLKYAEDHVYIIEISYLAEHIREIPKMLYLYRDNLSSVMYNRTHGIEFFLPQIHGWLRLDKRMQQFSTNTREVLNAGHFLARKCILSMAQEHYKYFGRKKSLYDVLSNLDIYEDFLRSDAFESNQSTYNEYCLFNNHPNLFLLKYYFIGTLFFIYKKTFSRFDKRQYSLPNKYLDLNDI